MNLTEKMSILSNGSKHYLRERQNEGRYYAILHELCILPYFRSIDVGGIL